MKYIILSLLVVLCPLQAEAGIKSKLAMGAAGFIFTKEVVPALATGAGTKLAVAAVKRLAASPATKNMVNSAIAFYIVTSANTLVGQRSKEVAGQAGLLDDPDFVNYPPLNASRCSVGL